MVNDGEFARDMSFSTLSGKQSNRTSPKTFQATNQQLRDVQHFCSTETPVGFRSILGIDGAHNCGEFYITLTTYHHPFIENKATGRPLLMIGPSVTQTTKTDEDYQYFLQQLDTHSQLINKKELILAAVGMMAKQQLKKDELIPILEDIFGKVRGDLKVKGIVDCESSEEFEGKSEQLKAKWQKVLKDEDKTGSFITYFDQHISPKIKRDIFQLVQQQNRVVKRAYLALGDYQLKQEFQHHGVSLEQWRSMTKDQQAAFINKLETWSIKRLLQVHKRAAVDIAGPHESNIKGMIEDGHKINKTMNGVVPYPADVTGSQWFVCSPPIASSSTAPDVACQTKVFKIEKTKTGTLICHCPKNKSFGLCCHVCAVADKLNILETVVNSFQASSKELPDPFLLIEKKLAPQAGKKENQKRKGKDKDAERSKIPLMYTQDACPTECAESSSLEIRKNEAAIALLDLKTATPKSSSKRDVPARIAFTLTHLGLKREWQKAGGPPCISPKCVYTYYHFDANCVKRRHPSFKGSDLLVPPEIVPCLLQCHRDLLKVQFGQ
eukprot:gene2654-3071_t